MTRMKENIKSIIYLLFLWILFIGSKPETVKYVIALFNTILIIFILIVSRKETSYVEDIPFKKKYIYPYILFIILSMLILSAVRNILENGFPTYIKFLILISTELSILSIIFIVLKLFKIKVKDFTFKIDSKTVILCMLSGFGYIVIYALSSGSSMDEIKQYGYLYILFKALNEFLYTAFVEEITGRGLFIGWLKSYNISESTINIMQAILFGMLHFSYGTLILTSYQMISGYLLGMIYIRKKSLMPGMIIHAFNNTAILF